MASFLLSGCDSGEKDAASKINYKIELKTEGGMPLEDVGVFVYADVSLEKLIWANKTDKDGNIVFDAVESDKYVAVLKDVPASYSVEDYYDIVESETEIKLDIIIADGIELGDVEFDLGSIVCDFTVTSVDGTEYAITELLEAKKAVILNFWFINCGPCKMEFPYLQDAYESSKDDIEVLAINPLDGTKQSISAYAKDLGLTFPMAVGDNAWGSCLNLTAYPTTVVIDRYGMISMIHKGSITESGVFEKIFEFYTSDDYVQTTVRNISEIESIE